MRLTLTWLPRPVRQFLLDRSTKCASAEVTELAPRIKNNKQFRQILKATKPEYRRAVYDHLSPKLSFKAKPFFLLNR